MDAGEDRRRSKEWRSSNGLFVATANLHPEAIATFGGIVLFARVATSLVLAASLPGVDNLRLITVPMDDLANLWLPFNH